MKENLQRPVSKESWSFPFTTARHEYCRQYNVVGGRVDLQFERSHYDGGVPLRIRRLGEEVSEILALG